MTWVVGKRTAAPVLVFRIGSLGDTVVSLPALHAIRSRHSDARIVLLTNTPADGGLKAASANQVLAGTGLIDDYIEYPHGSRSLPRLINVIRKIRRQRPELCYFLMPHRSRGQARQDRYFLHLSGIRRIVGLDPDRYATRTPLAGETLWESEALRLMRAIGADSQRIGADDWSLALTGGEIDAAGIRLETAGISGDFIVMSIGTKSPANDWGDANWGELLGHIGAAAGDHALVAIGSRVESARSGRLLDLWPGKRANLSGQTTPRESAAILARARLFVGHDSGPLHLANAVGTPIVGVFSARNMPGIWFPLGQEKNIFYNDVSCRGCLLHICIQERQRCIMEISPASVAGRAIEILEAKAFLKSKSAVIDAVSGG
jgi:ADP-heptose:LPS heptosyltransferase